jgi:hypothetical protein
MFSRVINHLFDCMYSVSVIRGAVSVNQARMIRVSSRDESTRSGVLSWLRRVQRNSYNRRIKSHRRVSRVHHSAVCDAPVRWNCSTLLV